MNPNGTEQREQPGNLLAKNPTAPVSLGKTQQQQDNAIPVPGDAMGRELAFLPIMSMEVAKQRRQSIVEFVQSILVEDEDFGKVGGSPKPTLLKPGAEKLTVFFGLVPSYECVKEIEAWDGAKFGGEPFFYYRFKCRLLRDGQVFGEGEGSCNSRESKYRYRTQTRSCPVCHEPAIIPSKQEYGGGWLCFHKKGGCGAKFAEGDPEIVHQQIGRVLNPDTADLVNTILKMATKRAYIAAVLNATGASEFFTQDLEDVYPTNARPGDTNGVRPVSRESQQNGRKVDDAREPEVAKKPDDARRVDEPPTTKPWRTFGEMREAFMKVRELVGETRYFEELRLAGAIFKETGEASAAALTSSSQAVELYTRLVRIAKQPEVA